ncbi:MAG TPA: ABC transporter permease [bacterium]|nr:ABC transporter permease [bacterium]
MQGFLVRRLVLVVPTLFLASLVIFAIITLAPGDPVRMMLGTQATPDEVAQERARLGLDRPVPVRYAIWMTHVLRLDLGRSQVNDQPVARLVLQAFPYTLRLTAGALAVSVLIGFAIGILAALRQNRPADLVFTGLASLGLAVPSFWLGILLILLFSVTLGWLPPSGVAESGAPPLAALRYLVLPVVTVAVSNLSVFSRFVRTAMLEVLTAHYIRTARAKGLGERSVVIRHALRNALIPVVTILGIQFGRLLGGALITEAVFAYPGIGRLVVTSILNRDYPMVQAALMLVVLIFLVANTIVDISYAYLDPRVKMGEAR